MANSESLAVSILVNSTVVLKQEASALRSPKRKAVKAIRVLDEMIEVKHKQESNLTQIVSRYHDWFCESPRLLFWKIPIFSA